MLRLIDRAKIKSLQCARTFLSICLPSKIQNDLQSVLWESIKVAKSVV